jgi:very-short-patch-repair endonuclease
MPFAPGEALTFKAMAKPTKRDATGASKAVEAFWTALAEGNDSALLESIDAASRNTWDMGSVSCRQVRAHFGVTARECRIVGTSQKIRAIPNGPLVFLCMRLKGGRPTTLGASGPEDAQGWLLTVILEEGSWRVSGTWQGERWPEGTLCLDHAWFPKAVGGNEAETDTALAEAMSALDRAAKVGAIHPNNAARRESRLALEPTALAGGTDVQATARVTKLGTAASIGVREKTEPLKDSAGNGEQTVTRDLAAHLGAVDPRARARIEDWAKKLVDLSRRNRLLHYRATKRTTLVFRSPDPSRIFSRLVDEKAWRLYMPAPLPRTQPGEEPPVTPSLDEILVLQPPADLELVSTERDPDEIERSLEAIARKARAEFEDRGTHVLHVVWGLAKWTDPKSGEDTYSPLVVTPVRLQRQSVRDRWELVPAVEEDPVFNPPLRVKLEAEFGISVPAFDPTELTPEDILKLLRQHLPKTWEIRPYAALGIFSFAKEAMYRDLVDHADAVAAHPMIKSLIQGRLVPEMAKAQSAPLPKREEIDKVDPPGHGFTVVDADSSQRRAIEAARRGISFVLHGPPGTGKSQTIANVIAEFIGQGKSVLFVSQKMAALEVVANRLEEVELRDLVLELHSAKASRGEVVQALAHALEVKITANTKSTQAVTERTAKAQAQLNGYVEALHENQKPLGRTAHSVFGELASLGTAPAVNGPAIDHRKATEGDLADIETLARRLGDSWLPIEEGTAFPWRGAVVAGASEADRQIVTDILVTARAALSEADQVGGNIATRLEIAAAGTADDRATALSLGRLVLDRASCPLEWLTTTTDLDGRVGTLLNHWASVGKNRAELLEKLGSRYGEGWEQLSPRAAENIERPQIVLAGLLGSVPLWDTLVAAEGDIKRAASSLRSELASLAETSKQLRSALGLGTKEDDGLSDSRLLAKVGRASQQRYRPLKSWLSPTRLAEAEAFAATHSSAYESQRQPSALFSQAYEPTLLDGDIEPLAQRMLLWQGRPWNMLRPQHRTDRKIVASMTRTRRLLPSVVADLQAASRLQEMRRQLATLNEEASAVLGPYARGLDTDFEAIRAAFANAHTLLGLPPQSTNWSEVSAKATFDAPYDPGIERLVDAAERQLVSATQVLDWVLHWTSAERTTQVGSGWSFARIDDWLATLTSTLEELMVPLRDYSTLWVRPNPMLCSELQHDAVARLEIDRQDRELCDSESLLRNVLRDFYRAWETDWATMLRASSWASKVRNYYPRSLVPEPAARRMLDGSLDQLPWDGLATLISSTEAHRSQFEAMFDSERAAWIDLQLKGDAKEACAAIDDLVTRIDDLALWHAFGRACAELDALGWRTFVDQAAIRRIDHDQLGSAARRAWLESWATSLVASDRRLSQFARDEHERVIEGFRRTDLELIGLGRERVLCAYEDRKPAPLSIDGGEQATIRREAAKRRRHRPVRQLLASIPTVLPKVKPCLMMSPLSVSQFLSPEIRFDVVIFDEASQVPPEDAINCIYRGKQLIVAGDPKQLPPTDFFQISADAEGDAEVEDQLGDFESILDVGQGAGLLPVPLEWHYRSRHDALISFSNRFIYNDSLVTFPAPYQHTTELGVQFVHVPNGIFDRGRTARNPIEARRVVEVVAEQVRANPDHTIGVVAFSVAQQDAIQDELARMLRIDPGLERFLGAGRLNGFFVKNLETVQGDERDVIVFSIGYGRDEDGKVHNNFGPINRKGGARRLNVAVTRARRKVIVVSSITAKDIKLADLGGSTGALPDGARLLRAYLEYAETGVLQGEGARVDRDTLGLLEQDVASVVRELGYEVVERVGTSRYRVDIGVLSRQQPGRVALGIECDGEMYRSAQTARDRDRLRDSVLRGLGWRIVRVWAQEWHERRQAVVERLASEIAAAERALGTQPARGNSATSTSSPEPVRSAPVPVKRTIETRVVTDVADLSGKQFVWTQPYPLSKIKPYPGTPFQFHEDALGQAHAERIAKLVTDEGPLHERYITTRLSRAFDLKRTGSRIVDAVEAATRQAVATKQVRRNGPFVWPIELTELTWVRVPVAGKPETVRPIEQIPPEEIDLCVLSLLRDCGSLEPQVLRAHVARILGFDRTGDHIGEAIDARILARTRAGQVTRLPNESLSLSKGVAVPTSPVSSTTPNDDPTLNATGASSQPRPGASTSPNTLQHFARGDRISHPRLGMGTVRVFYGPLAEIEFDKDHVRRTVDTSVVPITKIW